MTLSLAVSVKASSTPSACKKLSSKSLDVSANKTHVLNRQSAHDQTGSSAGKQAYMANHTPDHCSAMPAAKGPQAFVKRPLLRFPQHDRYSRHTASHPLVEEAGRACLQQAHICVAWPQRLR